jgi:hypothetical protein
LTRASDFILDLILLARAFLGLTVAEGAIMVTCKVME